MKRILLIIITCAILFAMTGCSPDPRVAPFKAWIVGVDAPTVLYNEDYGERIIIMERGEEAEVEIIHNREPRHKITIGEAGTDEIYVASVKDQSQSVFTIKALDEGCARVSVQIEGEKVQYLYGSNKAEAYVYVIVGNGDDSAGITVELAQVNGGIVSGDFDSIELNVNDTMTFKYEDHSSIQVDHVDWYVNGVYKGTGETFDYAALTPGSHNIRCIVYGFKNGDWTLGHSNEFPVTVHV